MNAFTHTRIESHQALSFPRIEATIFNMNRIKVLITNPLSMQERL